LELARQFAAVQIAILWRQEPEAKKRNIFGSTTLVLVTCPVTLFHLLLLEKEDQLFLQFDKKYFKGIFGSRQDALRPI
jgi:hypothetical protein